MKPLNKLTLASAAIGVLGAVTWITTYDSFSAASYILYQNVYIIPVASTVIIMSVFAACLLGIGYIERFSQWIIEMIEADMKK